MSMVEKVDEQAVVAVSITFSIAAVLDAIIKQDAASASIRDQESTKGQDRYTCTVETCRRLR
jgi:hypothetical protein